MFGCKGGRQHRIAFTLVEVLVVVAIIVVLIALSFPAIRSMQTSSLQAETYNVINAALQGVRSYAITNHVRAAARFQANGKIFWVYEASVVNLTPPPPSPVTKYWPVLEKEPMIIPLPYAVAWDGTSASPDPANGIYEPFYVAYNPDGTIAHVTNMDVNMATLASADLDFYRDGIGTAGLASGDPDDEKLWDKLNRFNQTANRNDPDSYAGVSTSIAPVNQMFLFTVPDTWRTAPIYNVSGGNDRGTIFVDIKDGKYTGTTIETIRINPYTGRLIRPVK